MSRPHEDASVPPADTAAGRMRPTTPQRDGRRLSTAMRITLTATFGAVAVGLVAAAWLSVTAPAAVAPPASATTASASPSDAVAPGAGPTPGANPTTGSETQPSASPETQPPPDGVTPPKQGVPLISSPLPDSADARGDIVQGFPADVAGPVPVSDVVDSSIARDAQVVQIALTARTDDSVQVVREYYEKLWTGLGLIPAAQDGDGIAYADRFSSLTLAFAAGSGTGTGTVYTVFGVLRAE